MALAAQEFAGKLTKIDNLTISPDMLSSLVKEIEKKFESKTVVEQSGDVGSKK
jgi:hypothetical protein